MSWVASTLCDVTKIRERAIGAAFAVAALFGGVVLATTAAADSGPPTRATALVENPNRAYLDAIKGLLSGRPHADQTEAEYIQGGRDMCADFDDGLTLGAMLQQVAELGGDPDWSFYRAVARAAIAAYCPQNAAALNR